VRQRWAGSFGSKKSVSFGGLKKVKTQRGIGGGGDLNKAQKGREERKEEKGRALRRTS